ncbi:MAG: hypothetical protein EOP05_00895 [Proteobacteria bacterium]|nr:MAG: hypothetical protein EOP05_00895 [Pseudomonadota bacterium]
MAANFLPMSEQMLMASVDTYSSVATAIGGVALAIFTARISLTAALISNQNSYGAALKDLLVFFVALALAPIVFKAIVLTSSQIAVAIRVPEQKSQQLGLLDNLMSLINETNPAIGFIFSVIPNSVGWIASGVYSVLLGTIFAIAPFIFLHQLISHQSSAITTLLGAVVALSSWPILWNAMGLLGARLWPSFASTTIGSVAFWAAITVLQFLSPLFSAMLIRSFSVAGAARVGKSVTYYKMAKSLTTKAPPRSSSQTKSRRS